MDTWPLMALFGLMFGIVFGALIYCFMEPKTIKDLMFIIFGLAIGTLVVLAVRLVFGQSFSEAISAVLWIVYSDVVVVFTTMVLSFIFDYKNE